MSAIIKSSGVISPQHTFQAKVFPAAINETVANRLICIEPEYREHINPLLLRRMPRILKMGLAASQLCIQRAGGIQPEGIIAGTGLGCLDNLEKFLMEVLNRNEQITSVLPFINSTHNAVAAQIAMMLKNHNYNTTYCHRALSFESALLDALMLIEEDQAANVLVGGIDECTDDFILLHSYLNKWKSPVNNLGLLSDKSVGTIAGEGSAFFMLSKDGNEKETVTIERVHTFFTPEPMDGIIESEISRFLQHMHITIRDVEGLMLGLNGDEKNDLSYYNLQKNLFRKQTAMYYKHLCGEYYTSSAFAFWLSSVILENHEIPDIVNLKKERQSSLKNILIYNHFNNTEHSLIFLSHGRL